MFENILVATDGSEQAEGAEDYAIDLAETYDATIHVLYVVETKASYIITVDLKDEELDEYKAYGEETVSAVVDRAAERGVDGVGVVKTGRIPEQIAEYAEDNDIDSIVVGKQGHGALKKYLGGTAEKVANLTDIPLTIVE